MDEKVREYFLNLLKNKNKPSNEQKQPVDEVEPEEATDIAKESKKAQKAKEKRLNGYHRARKR